MKCESCNKKNKSKAKFCSNCRYPLNVKKVNEFTNTDTINQLTHLFKTIKNKDLFESKEINNLYEELISLYWLRPETAVFSFIEAKLINEFREKYLKYPVLDLGCGDGMFTSIAFGSKINKKYDNFEIIDFNKTDPYDTYKELPKDFFIKRCNKMGYGIDIKENSVKRARDLKIFNEVKVGDIRKLPFKDNSMKSVYSNMLDDIKKEDLDKVLKEVNRVLKKDGYFVFTSPNENFKEFLYYYNKAKESDKETSKLFMEYDRGRSEWESRPLDLWKKLLKNNSFKIIEVKEYANKDFLEFWDTGLRPFFRQLLDLKKKLKKDNTLESTKKLIVDIMKTYLFRFVEKPFEEKGSFMMIVVRKVRKNE